jgi:hypothetical protein
VAPPAVSAESVSNLAGWPESVADRALAPVAVVAVVAVGAESATAPAVGIDSVCNELAGAAGTASACTARRGEASSVADRALAPVAVVGVGAESATAPLRGALGGRELDAPTRLGAERGGCSIMARIEARQIASPLDFALPPAYPRLPPPAAACPSRSRAPRGLLGQGLFLDDLAWRRDLLLFLAGRDAVHEAHSHQDQRAEHEDEPDHYGDTA